MTEFKAKIQNALDECRILVLGTQVLIGFGFRSFLEPGYEHLPFEAQGLKMLSLSLLIFAFAVLLMPSSEHQIVYRGNAAPGLHRLATRAVAVALVPFSIALSADVGVALTPVLGPRPAVVIGIVLLVATAAAWIGPWALSHRKERPMASQPTSVSTKVHHVLTEARVILPGAQTLLGFALVATLMDGFAKLPPLSQKVHAVGLVAVAMSVIILMMPATYHRLVEAGQDSEEFHKKASVMVLAALVPLGVGIASGFYVALERATGHVQFAAVGALALCALLYFLWFAVPLAKRASRRSN